MIALIKYLRLAALAPLALACNENVLPSPPPPTPASPPALEIVSGDNQQGTLGEFLVSPLVVRVTDGRGSGVAGALVRWTILAGAGEFSANLAVTDANGETRVSFRPTGFAGADGVQISAEVNGERPAVFVLHVLRPEVPSEVLIQFGPVFDCTGGADPSRFSAPEGTIPVGTLVEWEYASWLDASCAARLRTILVPPGASSFESAPVHPGERFGVILGVAGDWVIGDVKHGGEVTLRVR
ncbi:MAG TPA: Ig-like domain-containing protein [Gemmatimonadales bacterium]|nr:Ig-like domain-containing protein [Gemmatimonadales bacterium]